MKTVGNQTPARLVYGWLEDLRKHGKFRNYHQLSKTIPLPHKVSPTTLTNLKTRSQDISPETIAALAAWHDVDEQFIRNIAYGLATETTHTRQVTLPNTYWTFLDRQAEANSLSMDELLMRAVELFAQQSEQALQPVSTSLHLPPPTG